MIHYMVYFPRTFLSGLSEVLKCSDGLQVAVVRLDTYPTSCKSPHDWPVSLAIELVTICDIYSSNRPQLRPSGSVQLVQMKKTTILWLPITLDFYQYICNHLWYWYKIYLKRVNLKTIVNFKEENDLYHEPLSWFMMVANSAICPLESWSTERDCN